MKRVFLSLPMNGRTNEEIWQQIKNMKYAYGKHYSEQGNIADEIEFVHNMLTEPEEELFDLIDGVKTKPLLYLGSAITKMSQCDEVLFGAGWEWARGCRIEAKVAREYGITMYYMDAGRIYYAEFEK